MAPGVVAAITSRVNDKSIGTDEDGGKYIRKALFLLLGWGQCFGARQLLGAFSGL